MSPSVNNVLSNLGHSVHTYDREGEKVVCAEVEDGRNDQSPVGAVVDVVGNVAFVQVHGLVDPQQGQRGVCSGVCDVVDGEEGRCAA